MFKTSNHPGIAPGMLYILTEVLTSNIVNVGGEGYGCSGGGGDILPRWWFKVN